MFGGTDNKKAEEKTCGGRGRGCPVVGDGDRKGGGGSGRCGSVTCPVD